MTLGHYPNPDDSPELPPSSPEDDRGASGPLPTWALRLGSGLLALSLLATAAIAVWQPGGGSASPDAQVQQYAAWIRSQAQAVMGQAQSGPPRVLAVGFSTGPDAPVIGLLLPSGPPEFVLGPVHDRSLRILQRLFSDDRARTVTLVWLAPIDGPNGVQSWRQMLLITLSRKRAEQLDWGLLLPQDLPHLADRYQPSREFISPTGSQVPS